MKRSIRTVLMGICLHLLLTGFLLAGFHVYESSYDQMHTTPLEAVSLHISENTAELTILSQKLTVPWVMKQPAVQWVSYTLMNGSIKFWYSLIDAFTETS